jgi:hypothetical protein
MLLKEGQMAVIRAFLEDKDYLVLVDWLEEVLFPEGFPGLDLMQRALRGEEMFSLRVTYQEEEVATGNRYDDDDSGYVEPVTLTTLVETIRLNEAHHESEACGDGYVDPSRPDDYDIMSPDPDDWGAVCFVGPWSKDEDEGGEFLRRVLFDVCLYPGPKEEGEDEDVRRAKYTMQPPLEWLLCMALGWEEKVKGIPQAR